ncbi:hypothetical protein ACIJYF_00765 [Candidatus Pelagibacter bacterium nBUS_49]|uniref:hypothetical protein n=1 Tax=Candidatus Pelagibacter bacterium nBUS_49 TaxID=3374196 RepID=UPI003EB7895B
MKQVNTPKYIIVLGTTYSGSGAVFDYLNGRGEFYNPLKSIEYQLPHMPNGLMALEAVASSSFHPGTADYVLHNFEKNIKKLLRSNSIWTYGRSYEKFIPTFQSAIDEFVSEICEVNIQMNLNWHRLMQSPINYIISQIKNFFGIKNYVPLTHILVSEDKLVYAAQKFHDKIFLRNANNRPVLLNQAGSGWNPIKSTKYFLNCKIILVTRDPRDQYLEIKQKKKQIQLWILFLGTKKCQKD